MPDAAPVVMPSHAQSFGSYLADAYQLTARLLPLRILNRGRFS